MPSRRISNQGLVFGYTFAAIGLAVALFMPFTLSALQTDKLIEYEGVISSVERVERLGPRHSKNRVYVTINYEGGHIEEHAIRSSHQFKQLDQIRDALATHIGQSVIVSFLPNDRTLAEIKTVSGETLLDQDQLRASTLFTAFGIGISSAALLILMIYLHRKRQKTKLGEIRP